MVVDPWGQVLDSLATGEGLVLADLDFAQLHKIRQQMPVWQHKKF